MLCGRVSDGPTCLILLSVFGEAKLCHSLLNDVHIRVHTPAYAARRRWTVLFQLSSSASVTVTDILDKKLAWKQVTTKKNTVTTYKSIISFIRMSLSIADWSETVTLIEISASRLAHYYSHLCHGHHYLRCHIRNIWCGLSRRLFFAVIAADFSDRISSRQTQNTHSTYTLRQCINWRQILCNGGAKINCA